ncbi:stress up-regulated Nod 19 protein [Senna tora]|uniref:Stress up-regulated Nod 19 protein n=1 Tax=Senna tora TaxID=362788 RepID=A0A834VZZ3_9FABA|nr:stress up-regulated Nod 19 protein [Senna tora]
MRFVLQDWLLSSAILLLLGTPLSHALRNTPNNIKEAVFLSPKFELGPGSVSNKYFFDLEFPRGHIAIKNFTGEVVDEEGNSIPLHQTYLHHWLVVKYHLRKGVTHTGHGMPPKSDYVIARNSGLCQKDSLSQYFGLGSETRKTATYIPDPFGIEIGNPAEIPDGYEEKWLLNVHAIDTRGVQDKKGCTECRCDLYNVTKDEYGKPLSPGYLGGLKCCYDNTHCRVKEGFEASKRRLYMKYTVKWIDWDDSIVPVTVYIFDVTDRLKKLNGSKGMSTEHNCQVEYQVEPCINHEDSSGCIDVKRKGLPMPSGGYVIYGVTHQHAGGLGSTLYGQDGRVICSSKPRYGSGKEAGNEAGYIVGMSTCYPKPGSVQISNGETLTLESNYNSSQRHTGVMGLFYLLVADKLPNQHTMHFSQYPFLSAELPFSAMTFDRRSPARCFLTPPPMWKSRPSTPISETKRSSPATASKADLFHVLHKVPSGDSPYVKAKHVQLVDKDPGKAISMFWGAINAGDRVESALKDMALVMKQLDRSDEAIEAIKSFRHLCPSDSQESLDNILVELYKRSGRIDEEIAMLQHKLKKIEDGVTFVGRRTKQARSQGKKIHITVEQEISRILGNLAWAYLQKGDYKIAEEHYRKALSFEPDRNKQCNLAICLMQMNNITEAKFLLQAVSAAYKSRKIDDSFAKSYERASQMLIEIESQLVGKECRQPFGQNSIDEQKKGSYTESPRGKKSGHVKNRKEKWSVTSEVEVSYTRQKFCESPSDPERRDLKIPHTEPKRCSWGFNYGGGYQRRELWGDGNSDHNKPSLGRPLYQKCKDTAPPVKTDSILKYPEKVQAVDKSLVLYGNASSSVKKSWADMVEEDEEQELFSGGYTSFDDSEEVANDENWNSNMIQQKLETFDLKDESNDESESASAILLRNPAVRRSLCFNQHLTPESREFFCSSSTSPKKASNSEGQRMMKTTENELVFEEKRLVRRNRLKVFQDITLHPGTP